MRKITEIMINEYKIKEKDFMGYKVNKNNISYHHLIIPRRLNGPETIENGALLNRNTSHPYLHIIEGIDYEKFLEISSEMIDENIKGYIDKENIEKIDEILDSFEREYSGYRTSKGKVLIKPEFVYERKVFTKKL